MDYEDLWIETKDPDVKLHGWLIKQPKEDMRHRVTVLFFHGNAGNIGFRLPNAIEMYQRLGVNVALVDYRGYGASTGVPNEEGLQEDAKASLRALRERKDIDSKNIMVFGRSLGGAVAIALAKAEPEKVKAIILENTFLDIASMVDVLMPVLSPLKCLVLRMKWDNLGTVSRLKIPMLFLAGEKDELVPPSHMKTLYEKAYRSELKEWHSVSNGMHNDTWLRGGEVYYSKMKAFIEKAASHQTVCGVVAAAAPTSLSKSPPIITEYSESIPSMPDKPWLSAWTDKLQFMGHEKKE